ncbi:MAG TPA: hypothetical protein PKJ39_03790 [Caldisericia bacterium]|nr:hypothetical protein [Caldisericia bacterium]HQL66015.1 hypothetical protein [Caldisericia bacterium]HQN48491.1 hypothetical protein [Caldisericia bacterium]
MKKLFLSLIWKYLLIALGITIIMILVIPYGLAILAPPLLFYYIFMLLIVPIWFSISFGILVKSINPKIKISYLLPPLLFIYFLLIFLKLYSKDPMSWKPNAFFFLPTIIYGVSSIINTIIIFRGKDERKNS